MHSYVSCTLWSSVSALENCLHDIAIWMHTNYFVLSFIKTLALLLRGGHSGVFINMYINTCSLPRQAYSVLLQGCKNCLMQTIVALQVGKECSSLSKGFYQGRLPLQQASSNCLTLIANCIFYGKSSLLHVVWKCLGLYIFATLCPYMSNADLAIARHPP